MRRVGTGGGCFALSKIRSSLKVELVDEVFNEAPLMMLTGRAPSAPAMADLRITWRRRQGFVRKIL